MVNEQFEWIFEKKKIVFHSVFDEMRATLMVF